MALTQSHFRFGIEELLEATHGWLGLEDTNISQVVDTTFLLRFCVQADATGLTNVDNEFQYNKNSAGWVNITTSSAVVKAVVSVAFTNAQVCTKRLSGTGTFEASGAGCTEDGISGGTTNDIVASGNSETECALQIVGTAVTPGDTIQFRLTRDGGILLNTYAVTPSLIVSSGNVTVTPSTLPLIITKYELTVTVSNHITVTLGVASLTTTFYTPLVIKGTVVIPSTKSLILTTFVPTVEVATGGTTVTPNTASLITTRFIPAIILPVKVTPNTFTLTLTRFIPSVSIGTILTPNTLALILATYVPTVSVAENMLITPSTLALILTTLAPLVGVSSTYDIILSNRITELETLVNDLITPINNIDSSVQTLLYRIGVPTSLSISDDLDEINAKTSTISWVDINKALQIISGRWKILNNQMIFYDTDNVTPLITFNLKNKAGELAEKDVYERTPV